MLEDKQIRGLTITLWIPALLFLVLLSSNPSWEMDRTNIIVDRMRLLRDSLQIYLFSYLMNPIC